MRIALTFDIERDCPSLFKTTEGIERGLPKILSLLNEYNITSTFFITGDIANLFPDMVKQIAELHEVASHGYHHRRLDHITEREENEIQQSKQLLESITKKEVLGFRAPRLLVCRELYQVLAKSGFRYDSSTTYFRPSHFVIDADLAEYRVQLPNALFRFPGGLRLFETVCSLSAFNVLFFHSWEAIDMRLLRGFTNVNASLAGWYARPDRWYNTGQLFLRRLRVLIKRLTAKDFHFVTLKEVTDESLNRRRNLRSIGINTFGLCLSRMGRTP